MMMDRRMRRGVPVYRITTDQFAAEEKELSG